MTLFASSVIDYAFAYFIILAVLKYVMKEKEEVFKWFLLGGMILIVNVLISGIAFRFFGLPEYPAFLADAVLNVVAILFAFIGLVKSLR